MTKIRAYVPQPVAGNLPPRVADAPAAMPPSQPPSEPESSSVVKLAQVNHHPTEPQAIQFDPAAQELLATHRLSPGDFTPVQIQRLDRNQDRVISSQELDINADRMVTRNELYSFQKNITASGPQLQTPPQALPQRKMTGPALVQANNPEQVTHPGLQFSTDYLSSGNRLGTADQSRFRFYSYANLHRKAGENGFKPNQPVYQAVVLTNPSHSGQTIQLTAQGSSYTKTQMKPQDYTGPQSELMRGTVGSVRQADYQLSHDIAQRDFNLTAQTFSLAPGEQALVYVRVDAQGEATNDLRAFYEFEIEPPLPANAPLDMDVAMTQALPEGIHGSSPRGMAKITQGAALSADFRQFPAHLPGLKVGDELDEPVKMVPVLRAWQNLLRDFPKNDEFFPTEYKEQLEKQLATMISTFQELPTATQASMDMMNAWNLEIKNTQMLLNGLPTPTGSDKELISELFKVQFKMGRVNGIIEAGSEIESTISVTLGQNQENNYTFLNNPLNRAGAALEPLTEVSTMTQLPQGPANLASTSYGDYGMQYRIRLDINNPTSVPQKLDLGFATPDEYGQADPNSIFDHAQSFVGQNSPRFTGLIKLQVDGQTFDLDMVHGRIVAPESVTEMTASVQTRHQLQRLLAQMAPGPHEIVIEFAVPTNNTGPHLLQVKS